MSSLSRRTTFCEFMQIRFRLLSIASNWLSTFSGPSTFCQRAPGTYPLQIFCWNCWSSRGICWLPGNVFIGSQTVSLEDFAATLAEHVASPGPIRVKHGKSDFENYFAKDAQKSFDWPIHPEGFAPNELLELARLQGWTLKPARLR
jgi:hypothetical protein